MANAIACWEEDIAFVADYNAKNQPKAGRAAFKQISYLLIPAMNANIASITHRSTHGRGDRLSWI